MSIDQTTETWLTIKKWAEDAIEAERDTMETPIRYPGSDDISRGRIAALRALLALPTAHQKPVIPEAPPYT